MPGMVKVNPGDIMQAVETKLITAGVVPTADAIYWLLDGDSPTGKPTGKRDILIVAKNRLVHKPGQIGGGRIALRLELLLEVHLRTINLLDRVNTKKDYLIEHWGIEDTIIDALETMPTATAAGGEMTLDGLRLDGTILPHPDRMTPKWGTTIGTWRCVYLPKITSTPIG